MIVDRRRTWLAAWLIVVLMGAAAWAQDETPADTGTATDTAGDTTATPSGEEEQKSLAELWRDMLQYIRVARPDVAASYAQAILDAGADPREVYRVWAETSGQGADDTLTRAMATPELKPLIVRLRKVIDEGYEAERSDPQRIAEAIKTLGGNLRAYEDGLRRLQISGEYALPQLIQTLAAPDTQDYLKTRIAAVLPRLGRQAVRGLSVALLTDNPQVQSVCCDALREIGYPHAAPRLKELMEREGVLPNQKERARRALIACAGPEALKKTRSELFYRTAVNYLERKESLLPDVRYEQANVWYWQPDLGLVYKPVPTPIFCDVYAMRMARLALKYDSDFYPAVPLWLLANLKKKADLPAGATDPTHPEGQPDADFYALASSARYLQDVLAQALRAGDSQVAIWTIQALSRTCGAKSLVYDVPGGQQPLVGALTYGDRRVRFLAAESLAAALPEQRYAGSTMVLTVLNEAVRQTGQKRALLMAVDAQQLNALKDAIRKAQYELVVEANPGNALTAARQAGGVDVVVVGTAPDPVQVTALVRSDPQFSTVPVVIAAGEAGYKAFAEQDGRCVAVDANPAPDVIVEALQRAVQLGVGVPLSPEEAQEWAICAAKAVRLLSITHNPVYDLTRTIKPLSEAVSGAPADGVRIAAAEALAVMPQAEAQQVIVTGAALDEKASEDVRVGAFQAASESVRMYGNQLTESQAAAVLEVVNGEGSLRLRGAAAQLLGAMNLPSDQIKDLILATGENDK